MEYYIMNNNNKNTEDEKRDQQNDAYVPSQNEKLEENCNTNLLLELQPQFHENVPKFVSKGEKCWSAVNNNMPKTLHVTSSSSSPEPNKFLNSPLRNQQNHKDKQQAEDKKHSESYDMPCTVKTVIGDTQQDCSAQETIYSTHDLLTVMSETSLSPAQRSSNTSIKALQTGEYDTEDSSELQRKICINFSDSQQLKKHEECDRIELSEFSRNCERNVSEFPEYWYRRIPLDSVKAENVGISRGSVLFARHMSLKGDNQTDKTCFAKDEINTRNSEGQTVTNANCGKRYSEGQTRSETISDPQNNTFVLPYLNDRLGSGEFSDSSVSDEFSDNWSYEEFSDSWGCEEFSDFSISEECSSTSGSKEFSNSSDNEKCLDGSNSEVRSGNSGNEDYSGSEEYSVISSSEECSGNGECSSSEECSGSEACSSSSGNKNCSGSEEYSGSSSSEECSGSEECSESEACSCTSGSEECSESEACSCTLGSEECSDNEECSASEECSSSEICSDSSSNEECSASEGRSDSSTNENCSDSSCNEEYSTVMSVQTLRAKRSVRAVNSVQTVRIRKSVQAVKSFQAILSFQEFSRRVNNI